MIIFVFKIAAKVPSGQDEAGYSDLRFCLIPSCHEKTKNVKLILFSIRKF